MPRYFFHITDGQTYRDPEGTELPGLDAARREAFKALGDLIKGRDDLTGDEWVVDIADGTGQSLLKLTFSLTETRSEAA